MRGIVKIIFSPSFQLQFVLFLAWRPLLDCPPACWKRKLCRTLLNLWIHSGRWNYHPWKNAFGFKELSAAATRRWECDWLGGGGLKGKGLREPSLPWWVAWFHKSQAHLCSAQPCIKTYTVIACPNQDSSSSTPPWKAQMPKKGQRGNEREGGSG